MQNPVQMFTIRIGNKNLSETIPSHQFHNLLYTRSIQFVKNIIQQQQWNRAARTFQKIELCQFKCYKIRFILPLRTFSFYRKLAQQHVQLVFMNTPQRISHYFITHTALFQYFKQRSVTRMRII